jgi:hypothetical protein
MSAPVPEEPLPEILVNLLERYAFGLGVVGRREQAFPQVLKRERPREPETVRLQDVQESLEREVSPKDGVLRNGFLGQDQLVRRLFRHRESS